MFSRHAESRPEHCHPIDLLTTGMFAESGCGTQVRRQSQSA